MTLEDLRSYYSGRHVLVTGHTGFKGSWLCLALLRLGANVHGYALEPPSEPSAWELMGLAADVDDVRGDVRDLDGLARAWRRAQPTAVFHLAAQPLVRESYRDPLGTYSTNVMGTANVLECARTIGAGSVLNVTTDKVYENPEDGHVFREEEPLDGWDPYSNSKSCSELVTHSYTRSFARELGAVSTARAGNVIGGGDFAAERIVPDCARAAVHGKPIVLRNPSSVRPYQHVLEPVLAYLMLVAAQAENPALAGWYNVGPGDADCVTTGGLASLFCEAWGEGASWVDVSEPGAPHEAGLLRLDSRKIQEAIGWRPTWSVRKAMAEAVHWYRTWSEGGNVRELSSSQVGQFFREAFDRGLNER